MHRRYLVIAIALVAGVGLSLVSYLFAHQWELGRAQNAFRAIAEDHVRSIDEELGDQIAKLSFLRATYASSSEIAQGNLRDFLPEFHAAVRSEFANDPIIEAVVFLAKVDDSQRPAFTGLLRASGEPSFQILDRGANDRPTPAVDRPSYLPVVAAEPLPENSGLLGLDFLHDDRFVTALDRARVTGTVSSTAPLHGESGAAARERIWIFEPLFSDVAASDALRGATPMVEGYMGMAFYVDALIAASFRDLRPAGIDFFLYDASVGGAPVLFYTHASRSRGAGGVAPAPEAGERPPYSWQTTLSFAGRSLRIDARPAPAFVRSHTYSLAWVILGVALFSTALMLLFLVLNLRRSGRIEQIVEQRTADLTREIAEHRRVEESLKQAQVDVAQSVDAINQRSRELELLGEMGDLLQACRNLEEAYDVVASFARRLFPAEDGILFVYHESHRFLEAVATWGDAKPPESLLQPDDCWALRRGKLHLASGVRDTLVCQHVQQASAPAGAYLCLPMVAQGEAIGLMHLSRPRSGAEAVRRELDDATIRLVSAVAEHAAMAFANLKLRETLRQQSIRDPLTGLFNRRYMEESLERELHRSKRAESSLGVIIADVDHFKQFNDTFGHEAGDAVLRAVGKLLKESTRGEDVPCRYGGEEFVLILPGGSLAACRQKADALRRQVASLKVESAGKTLSRLTISLGVAVFPDCAAGSEELLRAADSALYAAKQGGRNRVESAPPLEGK